MQSKQDDHSAQGKAKKKLRTSVNQRECSMTGLVPQSTGKLTRACLHGATVFVDHFSNYTYLHLMQDFTTESTMDVKRTYEWLTKIFGVNVQTMDDLWTMSGQECKGATQTFIYSRVGAHHQNGFVEKSIQDLSEGAWVTLLHAIQCWPKAICMNLWPFALKYECKSETRLENAMTVWQNNGSHESIKSWMLMTTTHLDALLLSLMQNSMVEPAKYHTGHQGHDLVSSWGTHLIMQEMLPSSWT